MHKHTLSAAGAPPGCKRACWAFASAAAAAARAMASAASASCAFRNMAPVMNGECPCVTPQWCVKALQQQRRPWHGACVQPWTASVLVAWRREGHFSVLPLAVARGGEHVCTPLSSPLRPPSYLGRDLATTGSALTPCLFPLTSYKDLIVIVVVQTSNSITRPCVCLCSHSSWPRHGPSCQVRDTLRRNAWPHRHLPLHQPAMSRRHPRFSSCVTPGGGRAHTHKPYVQRQPWPRHARDATVGDQERHRVCLGAIGPAW